MSKTVFSGFQTVDLEFLRQLALNNDRDWFTAHRSAYDEQLKPALEDLVAAATEAMTARGLPLAGNPKKSLFRIHRDTRFSNDKRPYKTHVSATLTRTGADGLWSKMSPGMVYVHIEPDGGSRPAFDPDSIDPLDPSTLPPPDMARSSPRSDTAPSSAAASICRNGRTSTPSAPPSPPIRRAGRP